MDDVAGPDGQVAGAGPDDEPTYVVHVDCPAHDPPATRQLRTDLAAERVTRRPVRRRQPRFGVAVNPLPCDVPLPDGYE